MGPGQSGAKIRPNAPQRGFLVRRPPGGRERHHLFGPAPSRRYRRRDDRGDASCARQAADVCERERQGRDVLVDTIQGLAFRPTGHLRRDGPSPRLSTGPRSRWLRRAQGNEVDHRSGRHPGNRKGEDRHSAVPRWPETTYSTFWGRCHRMSVSRPMRRSRRRRRRWCRYSLRASTWLWSGSTEAVGESPHPNLLPLWGEGTRALPRLLSLSVRSVEVRMILS